MKKILAIAVATAISAPAMADLTLGGTYAFGYTNVDYDTPTTTYAIGSNTAGTAPTYTGTSNDTGSGFGTDTAAISLAAEHEFNGITVKGGISAGGLTRGSSAVTGENAFMSLSGDFGTVYMGEIEAGSGIRALGTAGAPVNNMEGEILGAAANIATIKYTAPAMGPVTLSVGSAQATGMGKGDDESSQSIAADVSVGMIKAKADYTTWQDDSSTDDRVRVSAMATFGMVSVGAGYENRNYVSNVVGSKERNQATMGVKVALSDATSIGAAYAKTETDAANSERNGYTVGFSHSLSSNMTLSGNYSDWEAQTSATTQNDAHKTNLVLSYSF